MTSQQALSTLIVVAGWGIGARLGWLLVDHLIERRKRRRAERESQMKNITPRRR